MSVDVGSIVARLLLDRTEFQRGLTEARAEAAAFSKDAVVTKFSADTSGLAKAAAVVDAAKKAASSPVEAAVSLNTDQMAAGEAEVAAAKRVLSRPVTIPVEIEPSLVNTVRQLIGPGGETAGITEFLGISKGQLAAALGQLASEAAGQAAADSKAAWSKAGEDMAAAMVDGWMAGAQKMLGSGGAGSGLASGIYRALGAGSDSTRGPIPLGTSQTDWSWWAPLAALGSGSGGNLPVLHGTALGDPFLNAIDAASTDIGGSTSTSSSSAYSSWWKNTLSSLLGRLGFGGQSGSAQGESSTMSTAAYQLWHLRSVAGNLQAADKIFAAGFGKDVYKSAAGELKKLGEAATAEGGDAGRNYGNGFLNAFSSAWKDSKGKPGGGGGGFNLMGLLGGIGVPFALSNLGGLATFGGGLFSLGGTMVAGMGATAGMGYDMYKTISSITTANSAVTSAQGAYNAAVGRYGAGSPQAASALSSLQSAQLAAQAAQSAANPAALPVASSFSSLAALLGPVVDQAEIPMYAGLASVIQGLQSQSGGIGSIFQASGATFGGFLNNVGADMKSPIFSGIVKSIAGAIPTDMGGVLNGLLHFAEGFGKLVETFQPAAMALAKGFDSLGNSFANWTLHFKLPSGSVSSMMSFLHTIGGAVSNLASAVGPLAAALAPLGGPVDAIILGLAKGVADLVKALAPGLGSLSKSLGPFLGDLAKWLPSLGTAAGATLGSIASAIAGLVRNAPQWASDAAKLPLIGGFLKTLGDGIASVAGSLKGGIAVAGLAALIGPLRRLEMFAGKLFLNSLVSMLKALGTIAWAGIAWGIRAVAASFGVMELSTGWVAAVAIGIAALALAGYELVTHWGAVVNFLRGPWGTAITMAGTLILGLVAGPIGILIGVAAIIALHWRGVVTFFEAAWRDIKNWFIDGWHVIYRNVIVPLEDGAGGVTKLWGPFSGFFKTLWGDVSGFFTGAWHVVYRDVLEPFGKAVATLTGAWNPLKGVFSALWGGIEGIFKTAAGVIGGIIGGIVSAVQGAISVFNTLTNLMGSGGVNNVYGLKGGTTAALGNLGNLSGVGALSGLSNMSGYGGSNTYQNYPGAATGGSPPVGSPFWVGENGPELMQLGVKSHVWDHQSSLRLAGSGAVYAPSYSLSVSAPGSAPQQVAAAVRAELAAHERRTVAEFRQLVGS